MVAEFGCSALRHIERADIEIDPLEDAVNIFNKFIDNSAEFHIVILEHYFLQGCAPVECVITNSGNTVGDTNFLKRGTSFESIVPYLGDAVRNVDALEGIAFMESKFSEFGDVVRYVNSLHGLAPMEDSLAELLYTVGNTDTFE